MGKTVEENEMIRPIPDWTFGKKVVLAMPGFENPDLNRVSIVKDFALYLLGEGVPVRVLVSSYLPSAVFDDLRNAGAEIDNVVPHDIWIRDWAPLLCMRGDEVIALKFRYANTYTYFNVVDNRAGLMLAGYLTPEPIRSEIIWDLGNFTNNGRDIIVTDQVLYDNKLKDAAALKNKLLGLGFDPDIRVFVLPCLQVYRELWKLYGKPAKEVICHIDGIMRFVDENKIVRFLPNTDKLDRHLQSKAGQTSPLKDKQQRFLEIQNSLRASIEQLTIELEQAGHQIFSIETDMGILQFDEQEVGAETLYDTGDYINFLRFGKRLFLPLYYPYMNEQEDKNACAVYRSAGINVTLVNEDFVLRLARLGGVLNCASWVI